MTYKKVFESMGKVFFIGLNKTGTTSLHEAMKMLGYKSAHAKTDEGISLKAQIENNYFQGKKILSGIDDYDSFLDWDRDESSHFVFKEFYNQYPDAKFVLNTRDLKGWLDSREKHVKRNQLKKQKYPGKDIKWLEIDREGWEIHYERHHKEVLSFFKKREKELLIFDISSGDGWNKLCPFLNKEIPDKPFPKRNIARSRLRRFLSSVKNNLINRGSRFLLKS